MRACFEGDWTDDTDQMILMLQTLLESAGRANPVLFGAKLAAWSKNGFPELGDKGGAGLGKTTKKVLSHKAYADDPHAAAHDVWDAGGRVMAPNGAVMRTCITGVPSFWDDDVVDANTLAFCRTTHADPRCAASSLAVARCVALLLRGADVAATAAPAPSAGVPEVIQRALDAAAMHLTASSKRADGPSSLAETMATAANAADASGEKFIPAAPPASIKSDACHTSSADNGGAGADDSDGDGAGASASASAGDSSDNIGDVAPSAADAAEAENNAMVAELMRHGRAASVEVLELDDMKGIGYTYKCMGAGLWGLRDVAAAVAQAEGDNVVEAKAQAFATMIRAITKAGGDADTNGAVAGGLAGCYLGYSSLPPDWVARMPYGEWLEAHVQKLLFMLDHSAVLPESDDA